MRGLSILTFGLAGIGALAGYLIGHSTVGVGFGMAVVGALWTLVAGGSGSPSENLVHGRMGAFGTYWSQSAPLPQSPLWTIAGALLVFAAGIGIIALGYS